MILLNRTNFLRSTVMVVQFFQSSRVDKDVPSLKQSLYRKPPAGVDYDTNETVFGKILRGEEPALTFAESTDLLCFEDIKPRAPTHGLIIPKRFIESVFDLTLADVPLLEEMQNMAVATMVARHGSDVVEKRDYNLCFHVPPFNSVDHLHLHVLAPQSEMHWFYRWVKYNTDMRWSVSLDVVLERLRNGKKAVPYAKPTTLTSVKQQAKRYFFSEQLD